MSKLNRRTFLKGATCSTVATLASGILPSGARIAYGGQVGDKCVVWLNHDGGEDTLCSIMPAGGALTAIANSLNNVRQGPTRPIGTGIDMYGGTVRFMAEYDFVATQNVATVYNCGYDLNRGHSRSHAEARRNMEAATVDRSAASMTMEGLFTKWQRNSSRFPTATNCLDRSAGNTQITNGGASSIEANNLAAYNLAIASGEAQVSSDALIEATLADTSPDNDTRDAIVRAVQSARDDVAAVQVAAQFAANNLANFPQNNSLSSALNDIAAAIIHLPTKFAIAKQGGYDTHSNQDADQANGRMARLITSTDDALEAFFTTLANAPGGDRTGDVIVVITTEFGRTYNQNGSDGSDHAMGSTALIIGPSVNHGFYGTPGDPNENENRNYENPTTHIGQIWADVMRWMGDNPANVLDGSIIGTLGIL